MFTLYIELMRTDISLLEKCYTISNLLNKLLYNQYLTKLVVIQLVT